MLSQLKANKVILLFLSIGILFLMTCEDYQSEDYTPTQTDEMAISVFKDTNTVDVGASVMSFDSTTSSYILSHGGDKDTIPEASFSNIMDSLAYDSVQVTPGAIHYKVTITKEKTNVIYLESTTSGEVVLCTDEMVAMNVVDDNNVSLTTDNTMPLELMAGHYFYDPDEVDYPEIIIKTRHAYSVSSGNYLVTLTSTEQTDETTFSFVVVNEQ